MNNLFLESATMPPNVKDILNRRGDAIVNSIKVGRTPVQRAIQGILKSLSTVPYDQLFHLFMVFKTTKCYILFEKNATSTASTTGMVLTSQISSSSNTQQGMAVLSLFSGNTWVYLGNVNNVGNDILQSSGGSSPSLSGALDRIRLTTVNGTDTFDAGSINILYE
jgi:hypothetical protein